MFRNLADFHGTWAHEAASTVKLMEQLTDESLSQAIYPGGRTLGRLANHLIETLTEMPHHMGLGIEEEKPAYTKAADIVSNYKRCSEQLTRVIASTLTDENLDETANMYGQQWAHRFTLGVLVLHQVHHRAQMTVLMRQAGLKVPGLYGPSKEEWEQMGMNALD